MKKNMIPVISALGGLVLVLWAINLDGSIMNFVDIPSIIIVMIGSFCALMISFPFRTLTKIPSILKQLLVPPNDNRQEYVLLFSELARKARRDGLLAIEDDINEIDDVFLVTGLQMVIDGVEPEAIKEVMELELDVIDRRHRIGQEIFLKWGELAPAFGMVGTIIGLINMLSRMEDMASIASGMATALITTFYGSLMANLIFLPIAYHLSAQTDEEIFTYEMIIEGILAIQAGSNPRVLEERLSTYLSTDEKEGIKDSDENLRGAQSYE